MYRPRSFRKPCKSADETKKENLEIPKPSFATECDNEPVSKKIPERPDEPISLEDLTRAKSDIREDIFIQDMFVMDQLDEISERIKNMQTTAESRIDTSVELGCMFEPQDRLFLETLEKLQLQVRELRRQEHSRYHVSSFGTYERSRRHALVTDLDAIYRRMTSMMERQNDLLHKEYSYHNSQLDLIDSTLSPDDSEKDRRAKNYLTKFRSTAAKK